MRCEGVLCKPFVCVCFLLTIHPGCGEFDLKNSEWLSIGMNRFWFSMPHRLCFDAE